MLYNSRKFRRPPLSPQYKSYKNYKTFQILESLHGKFFLTNRKMGKWHNGKKSCKFLSVPLNFSVPYAYDVNYIMILMKPRQNTEICLDTAFFAGKPVANIWKIFGNVWQNKSFKQTSIRNLQKLIIIAFACWFACISSQQMASSVMIYQYFHEF